MAKEENFVTIYNGFEVNVQYLQNIFDEEGIDYMIKNDSDSALRAGFGDTTPGQARLMVLESQAAKAQRIVDEVFPENEATAE